MTVSPFLLLALVLALVGAQAPMLFPYPNEIKWGSQNATINPNTFKISTTSPSTLLASAIQRYQSLLFPFPSTEVSVSFPPLNVSVSSSNEDLQLGVDESYTLTVSTTGCSLNAATVFGAMRGLETFSQLITYDENLTIYEIPFLPITINDEPRFEWRGLMIDTARHYLTVSTIMRAIDAASYNKFNTLHWHATDAESFPMESPVFPKLAEAGAYAPSAVYTTDDIADIVQYGLERGVRIVIEFDIPGHAAAWGKAYPNITTYCPEYMHNINNIPLNPSIPFTFTVLEGFLGDMASRFPAQTMHLGGDEVIFGCWLENQGVVSWMKQNNLNSASQVEQYFEMQMYQILEAHNKTMVCWQELFNNGVTLKADTIVEVWQDAPTLQEVIDGGYRGLVAFPYYLDKQIPDDSSTHYEWVDTWQNFYNADPYDGLSGKNLKNVIGGEAIMFAEQVDSTNFDSRVWPRASGVAERMWSPQEVTNITDTIPRLVAFRCRLAQRGIGAGPIAPDYCPLPDTSRFHRVL